MPPVESGSVKATFAHACSVAVSGAPPVAGLSVETFRSVKPKRAVKTPTLPVAFEQRLIVGGASDTAVAGAVSASAIWLGSTVSVSVVSSARSMPRLPPFIDVGPNSNSSGSETARRAAIGIVIEVAVAVTAAAPGAIGLDASVPNWIFSGPLSSSSASIDAARSDMLAKLPRFAGVKYVPRRLLRSSASGSPGARSVSGRLSARSP